MQIVIKIPEEVYEEIMAHNREMREGGKSAYYFEGLIQSGTPLPKGHGALIDRKELEEKIWDVDCRWGCVQVVDEDDILDANIVIPEDKESEE